MPMLASGLPDPAPVPNAAPALHEAPPDGYGDGYGAGHGVRGWPAAALGWALCLSLAGCISPPDAEALLAVGFRSPEQTFETFKTAVRGDLATLEYRCLSAGFRSANNLSAHTYVTAREELLRENPFIKWVARAKIEKSETRGDRAHYIEAVIDAKVTSRRLGLWFVRDDAVEIYGGDPGHRGELIFDDYVDFDDVLRVLEKGDGTWELQARERFTPYDPDADVRRIGEVRFLQDWKIDSLEVLGDDEDSDSAPTP